jgi:hypothetical protein
MLISYVGARPAGDTPNLQKYRNIAQTLPPNASKLVFMGQKWFLIILLVYGQQAVAGNADVLQVKPSCTKDLVCSFAVTVEHADSGWDHYANKWDVLTTNGTIVASRELLHPHENEQPFTRSLHDVKLPAGTKEVDVRAYDSVHGYGGQTVRVSIP